MTTSQTKILTDLRDRFDRAETGEEFAHIAAVEAALTGAPLYCPTCGVQLWETDTVACGNSACVIGG